MEELRADAAHTKTRAALYRRKILLGRGEARRLDELERRSSGAAKRLAAATARTSPTSTEGTP
jgi:hypothetical protein